MNVCDHHAAEPDSRSGNGQKNGQEIGCGNGNEGAGYRPRGANLIELHDVAVEYDGYRALTGVNLEIGEHDFLGLIGPNGGGKTTLVKAILGVVPCTGEVVRSADLYRDGHCQIGYLPQQTHYDVRFPISIREVVLSGLLSARRFGRYTAGDRRKAQELLQMAGIEEVADKAVGEVSGGQMQRALLCRAIISDPKLLILDEPTNYVDNRFESRLYSLLQELNRHMAIVMVSHDIGTITSVVREIVCVNRTVHRHRSNRITPEQLLNYDCPIQIITHGDVPHTVLEHHTGDGCREH